VLPAATGAELGAFLKANVAANSHLLTDGFAGYRGRAADLGAYLKHTPVLQNDSANAGEFFPIIHTLFSNSRYSNVIWRHCRVIRAVFSVALA
jgi:hypothetical protein